MEQPKPQECTHNHSLFVVVILGGITCCLLSFLPLRLEANHLHHCVIAGLEHEGYVHPQVQRLGMRSPSRVLWQKENRKVYI